MTRLEAHALLDAARAGGEATRVDIARALVATGDLDGECPTQIVVPAGLWERGAGQLLRVAQPFDGLLS